MPRIPFSPSSPKSEHLVVIAPHPDDEALGAGGLISYFVENGNTVDVILLTMGDGFVQDAERYYLSFDVTAAEYINLGYRRMRETIDAMAVLGVGADHVHFLGFPDGGLDRLLFDHWDQEPFCSTTTGVSYGPYIESYGEKSPYLGRTLLILLRQLLVQLKPTWIVSPSAYDEHPDHWAAGAFARLAGTDLANPVHHFSYLVHWPGWPLPLAFRPRLHQKAPHILSQSHPGRWREFVYDADNVARKRRALMTYQSQVELIKPFMLAFARRSEVLLEETVANMPTGHWITVPTPSRNHWTRYLKQESPINNVAWAIFAKDQHVRVEWDRPMRSEEILHISLHMPHTQTLRHWRIDASGAVSGDRSDTVQVSLDPLVLEASWPISEFDGNQVAMVGVQMANQGVWIGRTAMERYRVSQILDHNTED